MAASYIKLFLDFLDVTSRLTYEEKGRLIEAMVIYAKSGVETDAMVGNEAFLFPMFKAQIDRDKAAYEEISMKRRAAGSRGGLAKVANATKCKQDNEDIDRDIDNDDKLLSLSSSSFSSECEDIPMILREYIRTYVSEMPLPEWGYVSKLILMGMEESVIRFAIDRACSYGCSKWTYIRKILEGWQNAGVRTLSQARAEVAKFEEGKRQYYSRRATDPNTGYQHHDYTEQDFDEKFMYDPTRDFLPETDRTKCQS